MRGPVKSWDMKRVRSRDMIGANKVLGRELQHCRSPGRGAAQEVLGHEAHAVEVLGHAAALGHEAARDL
eukprot:13447162-Alexandrium_andersonii.AAC.1